MQGRGKHRSPRSRSQNSSDFNGRRITLSKRENSDKKYSQFILINSFLEMDQITLIREIGKTPIQKQERTKSSIYLRVLKE
jgi:hypothetical protein